MKYNNSTKAEARGWAWNRVCERIPKQYRKSSRVFCLIGDTTKELETAEAKGFSRFNVIGVDTRKKSVQLWRDAGGLAIQAPIEMVTLLSKIPPQAVIADLCCGLKDSSFLTFTFAIGRVASPGCIVINLLRGRDKVKEYRPDTLVEYCEQEGTERHLQMLKRRSVLILSEVFKKMYHHEITQTVGIKKWPPTKQELREVEEEFDYHFTEFKRMVRPQFFEYKSADSNQWFDTLAMNPIDKDKKVLNMEGLHAVLGVTDSYKQTKKRLAALEATRTIKLKQVPEHHRSKYTGVELKEHTGIPPHVRKMRRELLKKKMGK